MKVNILWFFGEVALNFCLPNVPLIAAVIVAFANYRLEKVMDQ